MELQQEISLKNNADKIGQTLKVIVDRFEDQYIVGRTEFDSPEVDQEVLVINDKTKKIQLGDFIDVKITTCENYDLMGEIQ